MQLYAGCGAGGEMNIPHWGAVVAFEAGFQMCTQVALWFGPVVGRKNEPPPQSYLPNN